MSWCVGLLGLTGTKLADTAWLKLVPIICPRSARANNGGTEAINGIIELHRRLARGYRNRENYRLRMLLAAGGLTP